MTEHAAGNKHVEDFSVERSLALMDDMMNGKAGQYNVEDADIRQGLIQIMSQDHDRRVASEPRSRKLKHGWRKIDSHRFHIRPTLFRHSNEPASTSSEIENARRFSRKML